jgi:ketosteroid isomerase-like protein
MSPSNADLVRGLYASFARGDVPSILATLDQDIEWRAPANLPHGGDFRGREAVGGFFQGIGEHWESLKVDLETLVDSGDRVVALVHAHGRLRANGEEFAYSAAHAWTIDDGTLVRFDEYVNAPLSLPSAHPVTG